MKCRVIYHTKYRYLGIHVAKKDREQFFNENKKDIVMELQSDNHVVEGHAKLTADFFGKVGQIRKVSSAAAEQSYKNLLTKWLKENKLELGDIVTMEVITPYKRYRLSKE